MEGIHTPQACLPARNEAWNFLSQGDTCPFCSGEQTNVGAGEKICNRCFGTGEVNKHIRIMEEQQCEVCELYVPTLYSYKDSWMCGQCTIATRVAEERESILHFAKGFLKTGFREEAESFSYFIACIEDLEHHA